MIPAGYSDPMQQHKSYCGHKAEPSWDTTTNADKKTVFSVSDLGVQCEKINGQRNTGTAFFNSDVNLPLLEVCEAKAQYPYPF